MPGVLLVLTAEDWKRAGLGELTVVHPMPFSRRPADERRAASRPSPAAKCATSATSSPPSSPRTALLPKTAAEAVAVDYEPLPCCLRSARGGRARAPLVARAFRHQCRFRHRARQPQKTEAAMAGAAKVVELRLRNSRLSANPMEPRAYLCEYDAAADRYTLYATSQQPHYLRRWLSVYTLHIPEHKIRVISPDVGGGFGVKGNFAVEVSTIVWAAQMLRRPVRWTATRTRHVLVRRAGARSRHPRPHGF